MPTTYPIVLTDAAKAAVESASLTLAEVEALARKEIDAHVLWPDPTEMEIPVWGFHAFETQCGAKFVAWFNGPDAPVEVDAVARMESAGRLSDETAEWLGVEPAEVVFPVRPSRK